MDYFDEQKFIELTTRQSVEVFRVLDNQFDFQSLSDEMFRLFHDKENTEIKRIHKMIHFFESDSCLSIELANYFGENLPMTACGHCSHCKEGQLILKDKSEQAEYNFSRFTPQMQVVHSELGQWSSINNLTRYFCGLNTPLFTKLRLKKSNGFGSLEKYSYHDVREWIKRELETS